MTNYIEKYVGSMVRISEAAVKGAILEANKSYLELDSKKGIKDIFEASGQAYFSPLRGFVKGACSAIRNGK